MVERKGGKGEECTWVLAAGHSGHDVGLVDDTEEGVTLWKEGGRKGGKGGREGHERKVRMVCNTMTTHSPSLPPSLPPSLSPSCLTRSLLNSSQKAGFPTRGAPKEYMCRQLVEQS